MCKDTTSVTGNVKRPKEANLKPFTPMTAKQAAEASARARSIRKQVRAEMLNTVVQSYNFGEELSKALKKGDLDKVTLLKEAMKLIGLTHDQSEEAVTKMQIDATTDNKTELSGQIEFVIPPKQ